MIDSQRWAGTQAAYRGGQLSNFLRPEDRPRSWRRGLGVPNNGIVTRTQCIRNGSVWFLETRELMASIVVHARAPKQFM